MTATRVSLLALAIAQSLLTAQAEELSPITVQESVILNPNYAEPPEYNRSKATSADGGDFLRQINGVSGSRFGGRGIEPIIRGQSQTRLNVLLDGAYIHGGCPNRMDPPSSWAALETYEKVTVLKGVQTLVYGGGGSGGTVLFERDTRALAEDKGVHGRVSLMGSDNGIDSDLSADVVGAGESGYWRAIGEIKNGGNYEDGDGNEVPASFDHKQGGVIVGLTPTEDRLIELSAERNLFEDALYPGSMMDSPEESANIYRLRYEDRLGLAWAENIEAEIYQSNVDHLMDNFSLRPLMMGKPKMSTATTSDTTGGRITLQGKHGVTQWQYGIDLQQNQRDATLSNVTKGVDVAFMWPDAEIRQTGLFAEALRPLDAASRLTYGLRLDWVDASADKADQPANPQAMTAQMAYNTAYEGTPETDQEETNVGALLRYERDLSASTTVFAGLSRSVRTADATERYMNKMTSWVGNPEIEPEKHHQLDIGVRQQLGALSWDGVVFYDDVSDYILRDLATGQAGISLANSTSSIYRNVDARLYGAELEAGWLINANLELSAALAYVHATNTTDDRPIAQIPPLNGQLALDYTRDRWGLGTRVRFADEQDRIDEAVAGILEPEESDGYAVLDLYGHYDINRTLNARVGIDNVFDTAYAVHVNRAYSALFGDPTDKVAEPGRTLWVKLRADF